jgi:hypothetical protein
MSQYLLRVASIMRLRQPPFAYPKGIEDAAVPHIYGARNIRFSLHFPIEIV